jgi:hypothetical protein
LRATAYELWRLLQRARRTMWPGAASAGLLVTIGIGAVIGIAALVYFSGFWSDGDKVCSNHALLCGLGLDFIGPVGVGVTVYYLVFLRRGARADARWRASVRALPETRFEWLPPLDGLTGQAMMPARRGDGTSLVGSIIARQELVKDLAADLEEAPEPRILVAPTGAGKTMALVKLAHHLSQQDQVAVPVLLRGRREIDFEALGQDAYARGSGVRDEEEARKRWDWLQKRGLVTVLADELDESAVSPADRVRAIETAARSRLRLVVATRPDGLPASYRRGRIDLEDIPLDEVVNDLVERLQHSRRHVEPLLGAATDTITTYVERVVGAIGIAVVAHPYYLSLARVLADIGALGLPAESKDGRLFLLRAYRDALTARTIRGDVGLPSTARTRILRGLEAVAFVQLLGINDEERLYEEVARLNIRLQLQPAIDPEDSVTGAVRLGILIDSYDGQVTFGHPTTLAFFASCFVVRHPELWSSLLAGESLPPSVDLAIALATADPGQQGIEDVSRTLLARSDADLSTRAPAAGLDDAGSSLPTHPRLPELAVTAPAYGTRYERLTAVALATEIAAVSGDRSVALDAAVRELADRSAPGRELVTARLRLVRAIVSLRSHSAYEALWAIAAHHKEYLVRREAAHWLLLVDDARLDLVVDVVTKQIDQATASESDRGGRESSSAALLAAGWLLPALRIRVLRSSASGDSADSGAALTRYHRKVLAIAQRSVNAPCAEEMTHRLDLEARLAQGLKLAIIRVSDLRQMSDASVKNDSYQLEVNATALFLSEGRTQSWFARVLILQAIAVHGAGLRRSGSAERVSPAAQAFIVAGKDDNHPFVRETARLCDRAIGKGDWSSYVWRDTAEVGLGTPHRLASAATQLLGDMILALNLGESSSDAGARCELMVGDKLPRCLSSSNDRSELLGLQPESDTCPFAMTDGKCFCPYQYETGDGASMPYELSRAFCTHQRLTAAPLPWHVAIRVPALKHFWTEMGRFAVF